MAKWHCTVKVKHLFTEETDHKSVQESMTNVANVLHNSICFTPFDLKPFHNIPEGDDVFKPVDYANKLIGKMYDFADEHRIWVD